MGKEFWKIGELAKRTGLTVRALHHYDRKGLVKPSKMADSGHRAYTAGDIAKLQQVISLKQLGFSLEETKSLMESGDYDPAEVLCLQKERLRASIQRQQQLYDRLEELHGLLGKREQVTAEQFMKTIEVMSLDTNKYFTNEQLEKLKRQSERLGAERIREVEREWPSLIAKVREKLDGGTPADDPEVVELARCWKELTDLFSGGDDEIVRAAERFHAENPGNPLQGGMSLEVYKYIGQAMARL